jgi:Ca2+/Na+ antiporter
MNVLLVLWLVCFGAYLIYSYHRKRSEENERSQ